MRSRSDPHDDPRPRRKPDYCPGPVPTLDELQRTAPWLWVYCKKNDCTNSAPMALVPLIIRWGSGVSSDKLRRCAKCTKCGGKGATLSVPTSGPGGQEAMFPDGKEQPSDEPMGLRPRELLAERLARMQPSVCIYSNALSRTPWPEEAGHMPYGRLPCLIA